MSNSTSALRKLPSDIIALAPFQLTSLPPLSSTTHMHTSVTTCAGLAKDLSSVMSSLRRLDSASAAWASAGSASSSAASASDFSMAIRAESTSSWLSLAVASVERVSATVVFSAMSSSIALTSMDLASTSFLAPCSLMAIASTSVAACTSLLSPPSRRVIMLSIFLRSSRSTPR